MTYSLSNNCTKNYYNRTFTVQVIVEDVVTWIFLKHSVYTPLHVIHGRARTALKISRNSLAAATTWMILHSCICSTGLQLRLVR